MFSFLLNLWRLNRLTVEQVNTAATVGRITAEQAEIIKSTPR